MDHGRAIVIIQSLADRVDPYSIERFASDPPCQQADRTAAFQSGESPATRVEARSHG